MERKLSEEPTCEISNMAACTNAVKDANNITDNAPEPDGPDLLRADDVTNFAAAQMTCHSNSTNSDWTEVHDSEITDSDWTKLAGSDVTDVTDATPADITDPAGTDVRNPEGIADPDVTYVRHTEGIADLDATDVRNPVGIADPDVPDVWNPVGIADPDVPDVRNPVGITDPDVPDVRNPVGIADPDVTDVRNPVGITDPDVTDVRNPEGIADPDVTDVRNPEGIADSDVTDVRNPEGIADPDVTDVRNPEGIADPDVTYVRNPVGIADPDVTDVRNTEDNTDPDVKDVPDMTLLSFADATNRADSEPRTSCAGLVDLKRAINGADCFEVVQILASPEYSITAADIKDCLSAAVETNWDLAIAQLLPLLPEDEAEFHLQLLRRAIASQKWLAAGVLISEGHMFKQLGETDLMLAVQPGVTVEFARQFSPCDPVNCTDLHGRTALSYAAQCGLPRLVRFLVKELGASIRLTDSQGLKPLDYAMASLDTIDDGERRVDISEVIELLDSVIN